MPDPTDPLDELEKEAREHIAINDGEPRGKLGLFAPAKTWLEILKSARLARELTAILCTEAGQDVVERAKFLASRFDLYESTSHEAAANLAHSRGLHVDEIMAASAQRETWARAQCEALGFPVPSAKAPFDWLTEQIGCLFRAWQFESGEHERHHKVEDELRAALAEKDAEIQRMKHGHYGVLNDRDRLKAEAVAKNAELATLRPLAAVIREHGPHIVHMITVREDDQSCPACAEVAKALAGVLGK